ncbi:hypothetical protein FNT36_02625 [Hymenobacter setariae]|uniref:NERD domain-containing protein n=1 Tax=Hymenobacter setariae TaxID=2594794 RepID=A0A558C2H2_9BACT|nr:hypothetical protein [Hymenobacter setariae]TVT43005.1 hypothetical protein FNT36_02625 [Hymenobacter setariae]
MLVSVLPVPFGDAGRQRQYEAVLAAFENEADMPATVLLGNLGAFSPAQADIIVVQPTSLAFGVLLPQAGQLTIPALTHGSWQLDGQPLPGFTDADNPFVHYQQQLPLALAWLSEHLGLPEEELPPCTGFALFEAPLTFGPGVETQLHRHTAATDFQLVGGVEQFLARLHQLPAASAALNEDELLDWGEYLAREPYVAHEQGIPIGLFDDLPALLKQKLQQLWRWLGAEDIPADPPYGSAPLLPDPALRDEQEQARLHQLRQELLAELQQQRQEAAAREATRTQELAQLRQQLAQAGQPAAERQAELAAKAALEESLHTARAELTARNQELDARLRQLEQLSQQLRAAPVAVPARPASQPVAAPRQASGRATPPKVAYRRMQQAERWGLIALAVGILGAGGVGLARWLHPSQSKPLTTAPRRAAPVYQPEEDLVPSPVIIYDSVAHTGLTVPDTSLVREAAAPDANYEDHEAARRAESAPVRLDSAASAPEPPRPAPADSVAASPAP